MMRRRKRAAKKRTIKKAQTISKKMNELQLEDWNQVESKLFDSISEKEVETNKDTSLDMSEPAPWNEWQEDWLFGDIDRAPRVNDINPDKKNSY